MELDTFKHCGSSPFDASAVDYSKIYIYNTESKKATVLLEIKILFSRPYHIGTQDKTRCLWKTS